MKSKEDRHRLDSKKRAEQDVSEVRGEVKIRDIGIELSDDSDKCR